MRSRSSLSANGGNSLSGSGVYLITVVLIGIHGVLETPLPAPG